MTFIESIRDGLNFFLRSRPDAQIIGQDIIDPYGGAFKATKGLSLLYPGQVKSMPISEAAMVGYACGRAMMGAPSVVEIMFADFVTLASDQLINQALKVQEMYGSSLELPLVIRLPSGGYRGYGPTHSQCLEAMFLPFPEIRIISPCIFSDPASIFSTCVQKKSLTLIVEHKVLYSQPLVKDSVNGVSVNVVRNISLFPEHFIRLADTIDEKIDVCVIAYGYQTSLAVQAMHEMFMESEAIVSVFSASDLVNIDISFLAERVKHCRRFLVIQEGAQDTGWAVKVETYLYRYFYLNSAIDLRVAQLGAKSSIVPSSHLLEESHLPSVSSICERIRQLL